MTSAKTVEQGNKPHYTWLVMIAYGLMMSGTIGSFSVVGAQWFYPVSTDIGCELSTLTLYTTIEMVCMGLAMPLVGNLLTRVKLPVILIAAVAMEVLATVAMAFYDEPWMWYVSGVFVGLGLAATSTVTVTPTMGNWFAKKTGFAIGVVETLVTAAGLSTWKDGVVFAILIVVLLLKPTGILGKQITEKV